MNNRQYAEVYNDSEEVKDIINIHTVNIGDIVYHVEDREKLYRVLTVDDDGVNVVDCDKLDNKKELISIFKEDLILNYIRIIPNGYIAFAPVVVNNMDLAEDINSDEIYDVHIIAASRDVYMRNVVCVTYNDYILGYAYNTIEYEGIMEKGYNTSVAFPYFDSEGIHDMFVCVSYYYNDTADNIINLIDGEALVEYLSTICEPTVTAFNENNKEEIYEFNKYQGVDKEYGVLDISDDSYYWLRPAIQEGIKSILHLNTTVVYHGDDDINIIDDLGHITDDNILYELGLDYEDVEYYAFRYNIGIDYSDQDIHLFSLEDFEPIDGVVFGYIIFK